jgi:hypothetical protein
MKAKCKLPEIENSSESTKELYQAPLVEIIEVKVEKGFAASPVDNGGSGTGNWNPGTW